MVGGVGGGERERGGAALGFCDECIVPCAFDTYSCLGCLLQCSGESEDTGVAQQSGLIISSAAPGPVW